jgi:hypothetical protein
MKYVTSYYNIRSSAGVSNGSRLQAWSISLIIPACLPVSATIQIIFADDIRHCPE